MKKIYEEIRCDYNPEGFWTVDAWEHGNDQGKVVALINDITGDGYMVGDYDSEVMRVMQEKSEETKSHILDRMKDLFMDLSEDDKKKFLQSIA